MPAASGKKRTSASVDPPPPVGLEKHAPIDRSRPEADANPAFADARVLNPGANRSIV